MKINTVLLSLLLSISSVACFSQSKDTLADLRQFIKVCSGYQSLPLHVKVEILKSSDIITSPEDTLSSKAEFIIQKDLSYIKFDDLEQVVIDSLMLFISNQDKRMALFPNSVGVTEQLKKSIGMYLQDSSLVRMSKKYNARTLHDNNKDLIVVEGRELIPSIGLPKESITVEYDKQSGNPIELVQMRRKFILIDSAEYNSLHKELFYTDKLFSSDDGTMFFKIKTLTTSYLYKSLYHADFPSQSPSLDTFIVKGFDGEFAPAKRYDGYFIQNNLVRR